MYLPLVGNNLPRPLNSIQLATYVWFFSLILIYEALLKNKFFIYLILLIGIFQIYTIAILRYVPSGVVARNTKEFTYMIIGITLLAYFYLNEKSKYFFGKLSYLTFIAAIITCFTTIAVTIYNPMIIRSSYNSGEDIEVFNRYGAGGYGFAVLIVMLIPAVFYLIKTGFVSRSKGYVIIGIFLITLIQIQIFANIIVALFITVFSLLGRKKAKRSYLYLVLIVIIFILIPQDVYIGLLNLIAENLNTDGLLYNKISDLVEFISIGEVSDATATGMKSSRYIMLFDVFSDNPILGGFSVPRGHSWYAGYHLHWMYKLASFGILGLLLHAIIHFTYIKYSIKYFDQNYRYYFLLSCFSLIGLGFLKALVGREMWVGYFVLLHGVYYIPLYKKRGKLIV